MPEHTSRTLPRAASTTYLKREAKALRTAFVAGDADARSRVETHLSPLPTSLAQAQALFVVAREYGYSSWPVLKRHLHRQTRTVFSDAEGVARALAELLDDAKVTIAETLEEAFDASSEVLVLDLHVWRDELEESRRMELRARKLVVTGRRPDWLCRELGFEIGGGNVINGAPLRLLDSALLGPAETSKDSTLIEPFAEPEPRDTPIQTRNQELQFRLIPEDLRVTGDGGFVDVVAGLANREDAAAGEVDAAIVAREANCVFAGVNAHPRRWSQSYRQLFAQLVGALAERELDEYTPAIAPKQIHPPGTVRFELGPTTGFLDNRGVADRVFHFRFDRPAVLTATLRHRGSDHAVMVFSGGRKQLHFTREDAEHGERLTIAVTIGQPVIDTMAGRYWQLRVGNFDAANAMSAELTVRYDALDGGAIRPMPSDASFEHFLWFAEQLPPDDAAARRSATAEAFGFGDWRTLQSHVAWSETKLEAGGDSVRDIYFAQAQARFGSSIGPHDLLDFLGALTDLDTEIRTAVVDAAALAEARRHTGIGIEHLLLVLLANHVTTNVLTKCGAECERLGSDLTAWLESGGPKDEPGVSRGLFGVLIRADSYSALGHQGCNPANVLVGVFAEPGRARELLEGQDLSAADVVMYLAHGIPKVLPVPHRPNGVLTPEVEATLHTAFTRADAKRQEAFTIEHLLLGMLDAPLVVRHFGSAAGRRRAHEELTAFVDATPLREGNRTKPTRALNRVMQQAVTRSRQDGNAAVGVEVLLRAIATERKTFAADVRKRYAVLRE
ncbi:MAG: hypothetical protein J4F45_12970 [Pseudomonadales bacterium]|nr:hypothetical protein [Pseudomonadales bacterium]